MYEVLCVVVFLCCLLDLRVYVLTQTQSKPLVLKLYMYPQRYASCVALSFKSCFVNKFVPMIEISKGYRLLLLLIC